MSIPKHVAEAFIEPLLAVFGEPITDKPELFFTEYGNVLKRFDSEILKTGKDQIIRTFKGPQRWPRPAQCLEACEEADEARAIRNGGKIEKPNYFHEYIKAKKRVHSELGRRAAREGWVLGLCEFIANHGREPNKYEIERIKDTSDFVNRCAAGQIHMGVLHDGLLKLSHLILARRERLAQEVLGEGKLTVVSQRMTGDRE